jgi:hypothetical protein
MLSKGAPAHPAAISGTTTADWQNLASWVAPVGRRWDIAVLVDLPPDGGWTRPANLLDAINTQAGPERQISWKVPEEILRRLEAGQARGRTVSACSLTI